VLLERKKQGCGDLVRVIRQVTLHVVARRGTLKMVVPAEHDVSLLTSGLSGLMASPSDAHIDNLPATRYALPRTSYGTPRLIPR
jgi:hypothetical protein